MKTTIHTENEGIKEEVLISSIEDYLLNIMEISSNVIDFIQKATNGLTNETNSLSEEDQETLEEFYIQNINRFK
jgi:hypothetical protein